MEICELMKCCFNNNIKGIKTLLECGVNDILICYWMGLYIKTQMKS